MKFDPEIVAYLSGERFSNGLRVIPRGGNTEKTRIELLADLVSGQDVIHFGCADHLPLIAEKRSAGAWLHARLEATARRTVGIDNDPEAVAYLREHKLAEVYQFDALSDEVPPELAGRAWDVMVLGEIIEHLDDPVRFLAGLRRKFRGTCRTLIASVPNAFALTNWRAALSGVEYINSDHRCWFTPYTIAKVLHRAGLGVDELYLVNGHVEPRVSRRLLYKVRPILKSTIVASARFDP